MKHTLSLLTLALTAVTLNATATGTDPLDFDYEIAGNVLERPALVFNDGSDTYFQPRAGQVLRVDGGHAKVRTSWSPVCLKSFTTRRAALARPPTGRRRTASSVTKLVAIHPLASLVSLADR